MAGRRRRQDLSVSLFPFLSVLACVIGTLTLLIAALAIGEMASDLDPAASTGDPEASEQEIQAWTDRIAVLKKRLDQALEERKRLTTLERRLSGFGISSKARAQELESAVDRRLEDARIHRRKRAADRELREARSSIQLLEKELALSRLPSEDAPIEILPRGRGDLLVPYFVECRTGGVRLLKRSGDWSEELHLDDLVERGRFKVFLEKVRSLGNASAIFLIRPDGTESFRKAAALAEALYVRYGKLPVPGKGKIDFHLLQNAADEAGRS